MAAKPTLADIAKAAHVSVSTVSKSLNGTDRVSAETRRMVQEIASQLGYQGPHATYTFPNDRTAPDAGHANNSGLSAYAAQPATPIPARRTKRARRSELIGLITADHNGRFALPLLVGAETTLGAANHAALLMSSHGNPTLERNHINQLATHGVDGIIVVGDTTNPRPPLPRSITRGLPVVYTYDPSTNPMDCSVICDNTGAGRQAVEYLIGLGRRHIGVVAGADTFQASRDRTQGALETFQLYGLSPEAVLADRWSEEWGEQAAKVLTEQHPHLDAVYCLSDEIARGMVRGLTSAGLSIPEDVAVIGHDNWDVFSTNAHPTLTTFDNNIGLIGRTAAQLLLDAIRGREHHGTSMIECSLIVRESTDPGRHAPVRGSGWLTGLEE